MLDVEVSASIESTDILHNFLFENINSSSLLEIQDNKA